MLGTWVGRDKIWTKEKRRGYAHLKKRLKNSKLTKSTQTLAIQAVVESAITFNSEIRAWQKKLKRDVQTDCKQRIP